jgi:hypothetical protein
VAALVALGAVATAEAAPVVYVEPVSQVVQLGDPFSVDIWIKNLSEAIGGFDLDLSFDATKITGAGFAADPDANFANSFDGSGGFGVGTLNLFLAGDPANDNLALNPFRLGRIDFTATGLGNSLLTISFNDLSNVDGTAILPDSVQPGIVCVVDQPTGPVDCQIDTVPEPALLALVGAGLSALGIRRRRAGNPL